MNERYTNGCSLCPSTSRKAPPEGWAIFIERDGSLTRVCKVDQRECDLWPGASPEDAVECLRCEYALIYGEGRVFYVNPVRGNVLTHRSLTRVQIQSVPVTTTELRAVAS